MKSLKGVVPSLDDSWFYHCARELYVPKDLINIMLAVQGPPKGPKPPTCFVAFDLDDGALETKAYFFPHIRAWHLGISQGALVMATVRSLPGATDTAMATALDHLDAYLANPAAPVSHRNVEMLAIDCIAPARARAKIYVNSYANSFRKVRDIYTLGGLLDDAATRASLAPLARLWRLVFALPDTPGWEDVVLPNIQHHRSCFVFGFEFRARDAVPRAKIYFPLWHYAQTDVRVCEALAAFYSSLGWAERASSYRSDVEDVLYVPPIPPILSPTITNHPATPSANEPALASSAGTHQYLSFAATQDHGLYLTTYYAPSVPRLTARHVPAPVGEGDPMMLVGPPGEGPPLPLRVLQRAWPVLRWVVPGQV